MEANESDISNKLLEIEYIRRELESYMNTLNALQSTQETIDKSLSGLDNLKGANGQILIPYSPDIYIKGNIIDADSVLVNIGSGVFKKLKMEDLRKKLKNDLTEVSLNIERIATIIQQLQEKGSNIEEETSKLYEEYSKSLK